MSLRTDDLGFERIDWDSLQYRIDSINAMLESTEERFDVFGKINCKQGVTEPCGRSCRKIGTCKSGKSNKSNPSESAGTKSGKRSYGKKSKKRTGLLTKARRKAEWVENQILHTEAQTAASIGKDKLAERERIAKEESAKRNAPVRQHSANQTNAEWEQERQKRANTERYITNVKRSALSDELEKRKKSRGIEPEKTREQMVAEYEQRKRDKQARAKDPETKRQIRNSKARTRRRRKKNKK